MANHEAAIPDQTIADLRHSLTHSKTLDAETVNAILEKIKANNMVSFYESFWPKLGFEVDAELGKQMKETNRKTLEEIDAKIEKAKENEGSVEVRDMTFEKANHFCVTGNKEGAIKEYENVIEQSAGASSKLEVLLTLIRMGIYDADRKMTEAYIKQALTQFEFGGDWEKRNRLKVYQGVFHLMQRNFEQASDLLLNAISTFTATELMSFEQFVFLVVISTMLSKDRSVMKSKLIQSPEVIQVAANDPFLSDFVSSLYKCEYRKFMASLLVLDRRLKEDRYTAPHSKFYFRSIRLKAYAQFLEPFRSVTLELMAKSFSVSEKFIEKEVASFITSGSLRCRIDLVSRIIEKDTPVTRDERYNSIVKEGDLLLSKIQKTSRVMETF